MQFLIRAYGSVSARHGIRCEYSAVYAGNQQDDADDGDDGYDDGYAGAAGGCTFLSLCYV